MIQREVICSFLGLYPWNSTTIDVDLEEDVVEAIAEKVATETVFTPEGRRFYDYCRGRHDEGVGELLEGLVLPDPETEPEKVTEWIRESFTPADLLQLFFTFKAPSLLADMFYEDILEYIDGVKEFDEDRVSELLWSIELDPNSKTSRKVYEEITKKPRYQEILEWGHNKKKERV